jgi:hypothetical protein
MKPTDMRATGALLAAFGVLAAAGTARATDTTDDESPPSGLYGDLWRAQTEIGYELRASGGFSLLYAVGLEWDLVSHAAPLDPASCVSPVCAPAHKPGAQTSTIRFGLGYAF